MTTRRSFLGISTSLFGAGVVGLGGFGLMRSCAPTEDVNFGQMPLYTFHVDDLIEGQNRIFKHDIGPIVVRRLSQADIGSLATLASGYDPKTNVPHNPATEKPATFASIIINPPNPFIALWQICTRKRCVPLPDAGDFKGFFCPCCATHYDLLGRVHKGIAPRNLAKAEIINLGNSRFAIPSTSPSLKRIYGTRWP